MKKPFFEHRGNSLYLIPPSGRGYYLTTDVKFAVVCHVYKGEGHHDSCFDCGNRGYFVKEVI